MLVLEKRCKVCMAVKANKQLLQTIYDSSYFLPHSKVSLTSIAEKYKLSYDGLKNHVKKHQFIDSIDYQEKMLAQADKKAERSAVAKAVKGQSAVQEIIDQGMQRLQNGDITVDTNQLLRASQIQMTAEAKTKDQELQAMEMIAFFASGSYKNPKTYESIIDGETTQ